MHRIIVGNTGFARMLKDYIEEDGVKITAFCANRDYIDEHTIDNIPVIALELLNKLFSPRDAILYLGIGYSMLGNTKKRIYEDCKKNGYRFANYIHPSASIGRNVILGEGNVVFENVVIQRDVVVGSGNLFWSNSVIMRNGSICNYNTFGACAVVNGGVKIGECNFIGSNATIRNGLHIDTDNLIGAGAFLSKDIDSNMIIRPAKIDITSGALEQSSRI